MPKEYGSSYLANADAWLKARRPLVIAAILVIATLIRAVAFYELHESPIMDSHSLSQMDMQFFHEWAERIMTEDALGEKPHHPLHEWHKKVAGSHFDRNPTMLGRPFAQLSPQQQTAASVQLWTEWYNGNQFHQEPLYSYFTALVYKVYGAPDVRAMYVVQTIGGILLVLLLYLASRRMFGDLTGVLTASIGMAWGPLIHYDVTLLRTSFLSLFGIALLYFAQRAFDKRDEPAGVGRIVRLFGFGLLIGLATALKSTFLIFSLGLLAVLFWPLRARVAKIAGEGGVICLGIVLALLPIWIRNGMVGAPLFSMTSVGPVTFAGSNVPGYVSALGWFPDVYADALAQAMAESGGSLLGAVSASVGMYDSVFDWFALLWDKFVRVWHWFEMPNNTNFYYSCLHSKVLQTLRFVVAASWVLPAGVIGFWFAFRRRKQVGPWAWYLVCTLGPMIVFYVLSRFRAPMVVGMMPFAAYAIVQVLDRVKSKRSGGVFGPLVIFVALWLLMGQGFKVDHPLVDAMRYNGGVHSYYNPRAINRLRAGDPAGAIAVWDELIATRPRYLDEIGPARPIQNKWEHDLVADIFTPAYMTCAQIAERSGRPDVAAPYRTEGLRLDAAARAYEARNPEARRRR